MGTPQCCQFNCMELTTDRFPRPMTNKSRPDKCTGCTGMQAHGALEDNPPDDDPLLATCSLMWTRIYFLLGCIIIISAKIVFKKFKFDMGYPSINKKILVKYFYPNWFVLGKIIDQTKITWKKLLEKKSLPALERYLSVVCLSVICQQFKILMWESSYQQW